MSIWRNIKNVVSRTFCVSEHLLQIRDLSLGAFTVRDPEGNSTNFIVKAFVEGIVAYFVSRYSRESDTGVG